MSQRPDESARRRNDVPTPGISPTLAWVFDPKMPSGTSGRHQLGQVIVECPLQVLHFRSHRSLNQLAGGTGSRRRLAADGWVMQKLIHRVTSVSSPGSSLCGTCRQGSGTRPAARGSTIRWLRVIP